MTELDKLEAYLKENGYKYERIDTEPQKVEMMAGGKPFLSESLLKFGELHQIIVYNGERRVWDAICHPGSYGYEQGLLEIMGTIAKNDDVEGFLTADQIIEKLKGAPK